VVGSSLVVAYAQGVRHDGPTSANAIRAIPIQPGTSGCLDDIEDTLPAFRRIVRQHPFWWFVIGPAGAAASVWGKRLGEDRPRLGYIVYILGLVLIAIGHGWAINWAYARLARRPRRQ
jgi:hypothetical protein